MMILASFRNKLVSFSSELTIVLLHFYAYLTWFAYGGDKSVIIILTSLFSLVLISRKIKFNTLELAFLLFLLILMVLFSVTSSLNGIYALFQISFTFILITFFCAYIIAGRGNNLIVYVSFNLIFLFSVWLGVGGSFKVWLLPNLNPNVMGFFVSLNLLLLIGFYCNGFRPFLRCFLFFLAVLACFLIFVSTARSVWLALVFCLGLYCLFQSRILNRRFFNFLSLIVIFLLFFFPHLYVYLSNSPVGVEIDLFVELITNKRFFTGRELIWDEMYRGLGDSILFGMGMGATNNDIGMSSSSHNLYMNLFFQYGIVGTFLFILSFYLVLKNVVRNLDTHAINRNTFISSKKTSLMGVLLISLLIQQSFELFLFQNNLPASFLFWFGLVLYYSQTYKNHQK